jgi:adenylate cyclase, class 2
MNVQPSLTLDRIGGSVRYPVRMKPPVENEIKLAVESAAKARALIRRHEFKVIKPRIFERNLVLDDERGSLRARGMLLRVREAGKITTCTFKGPAIAGRHKRRLESEFIASEARACLDVFAGLDFRETFRYEKYRTEFAQPDNSGIATVDETPIGVYLELEGPARWIDRTAKALGFPGSAYITSSYIQLYLDWCESRGIEPTGMRFQAIV